MSVGQMTEMQPCHSVYSLLVDKTLLMVDQIFVGQLLFDQNKRSRMNLVMFGKLGCPQAIVVKNVITLLQRWKKFLLQLFVLTSNNWDKVIYDKRSMLEKLVIDIFQF